MSILIFNTSNYQYTPFDTWLSDYEGKVILLTPERHVESYTSVIKKNNFIIEPIKSWSNNWNVERRAMELHNKHQFECIIALRENDLTRAASLRELLNISGQSVESAMNFRDKFLMKKTLKENNIKVPKFKIVNSYSDIQEFIKEVSYPVILKPRDGAGSVNTFLVENEKVLIDKMNSFDLKNFLIEEYIPGEVYHVDGIVIEDLIRFITPSKYVNNCMEFQKGKSTASTFLSEENEIYNRAVEYTEKILKALSSPKNFTFHLEFFLTPENDIVFCEVASRTGGGRIAEGIEEVFGFHLTEEWVRAQVGLDNYKLSNSKGGEWGKELRGWILSSPLEGKIVYIPQRIPFDWVTDQFQFATLGNEYSKAHSSVYSVSAFICKGSTENEVEERLLLLDKWFKSQCVYE